MVSSVLYFQAKRKDGLIEGIAYTFLKIVSKLYQIGHIRGNIQSFWVGAGEGGKVFLKTG